MAKPLSLILLALLSQTPHNEALDSSGQVLTNGSALFYWLTNHSIMRLWTAASRRATPGTWWPTSWGRGRRSLWTATWTRRPGSRSSGHRTSLTSGLIPLLLVTSDVIVNLKPQKWPWDKVGTPTNQQPSTIQLVWAVNGYIIRIGKGQGKVRRWSGVQVNVRWMSNLNLSLTLVIFECLILNTQWFTMTQSREFLKSQIFGIKNHLHISSSP